MKGTIVSRPDCENRYMGTLKDQETGDVETFVAGNFEKIAVGDNFRYRSINQIMDGGRERSLNILKKKLPS